jgi:hypothetical protein
MIKLESDPVSDIGFNECPDVGFMFNSDLSDCGIVLPGLILTSSESEFILRKC